MTSYREAGVDLDGADRHVESIAEAVTATWMSDVVGGFGGFAAGVRLPDGLRDPVLMMSTDGVGTKLELARRADRWEGVGFDLVAMCVDDLAAAGAMPIGFVDYVAVGSLNAERDRIIVESVAAACREAGCPLLGGETAEHPGVMELGAVDLAGAAMGVVDAGSVLGPDRVRLGDVVIGLRSPNVRSNGYSLIRAILGDETDDLTDFLEPSVIYTPTVIQAARGGAVHSAAHITGGGLAANLFRALPPGHGVEIDMSAWDRPDVFLTIAERGVSEEEMRRTFNLGIGFCLVTNPASMSEVLDATALHDPRPLGVVDDSPGVRLR